MGDDIMALIASIPRTMRTLQWAVQAGIGYKRLLSGLDPNLNPDAYAVQLSRLHDFWAQVCRWCRCCVCTWEYRCFMTDTPAHKLMPQSHTHALHMRKHCRA